MDDVLSLVDGVVDDVSGVFVSVVSYGVAAVVLGLLSSVRSVVAVALVSNGLSGVGTDTIGRNATVAKVVLGDVIADNVSETLPGAEEADVDIGIIVDVSNVLSDGFPGEVANSSNVFPPNVLVVAMVCNVVVLNMTGEFEAYTDAGAISDLIADLIVGVVIKEEVVGVVIVSFEVEDLTGASTRTG